MKEQALEMMLAETSQPHSHIIDFIHNVVTDLDDEAVYAGIVEKKLTLKSAFHHIAGIAKSRMEDGVGYVDPADFPDILQAYFTSATAPATRPQGLSGSANIKAPTMEAPGADTADVLTKPVVTKPKEPKRKETDVRMSIFDFMGEAPTTEDDEETDESA